MPNYNGYFFTTAPLLTDDHLNLAPQDLLGDVLYDERQVSTQPRLFESGVYTNNTPVEAGNPHEVQGVLAHSFYNDFYFRVHIKPDKIALGNTLYKQFKDVEIWNAYREPKLMDSILYNNAAGITIQEPEPSPVYFNQLQYRKYVAVIDTTGPVVIDAVITWQIENANSLNLSITGKRAVVWPFKPLDDMQETLEFKTDILQSFEGEQRMAIRYSPRQVFNAEFYLTEQQFAFAKGLSSQFANKVYGFPIWYEQSSVALITSGATTITVDTTNADYRTASAFLIFESLDKYEVLEVQSFTNTTITSKSPVLNSYSNCKVVPMRYARTLSGMTFRRQPGGIIFASAEFTVTDNVNLSGNSATISYPTYKSKYVLTQDRMTTSNVSEKILRSVDVFDNGQGVIEIENKTDYFDNVMNVTFDVTTKAQRWALLKFMHTVKGKRGSFYLPTWNTDLVVLEKLIPSSLAMKVAHISYELYRTVTDIMVQLNNGTLIFNRVILGSDQGSYDNLAVETAWPYQIEVSQIKRVCFMHLVRFDSDAIELRHSLPKVIQASIPVREVPA